MNIVEMGVETLVDEHLHGDAAVGEKCGRHAGGDRRLVDGCALLEVVDVHLPVVQPEEVAVPRVTHVERSRRRERRSAEEVGVVAFAGAPWLWRSHVDPGRRSLVGTPRADADGHNTARAREQRDSATVEIERRRAFEHVEALLEGVHVRLDVAVLEPAEPETHVHRSPWTRPRARRARTPRFAPRTLAPGRSPRGV